VGFDGAVSTTAVDANPEALTEPMAYRGTDSNSLRPKIESQTPSSESQNEGDDKIPVRLTEGRKAWLIVPTPFYEADKVRLKAQIDLLLTEDIDPLLK
jgi:hypothetical protein